MVLCGGGCDQYVCEHALGLVQRNFICSVFATTTLLTQPENVCGIQKSLGIGIQHVKG